MSTVVVPSPFRGRHIAELDQEGLTIQLPAAATLDRSHTIMSQLSSRVALPRGLLCLLARGILWVKQWLESAIKAGEDSIEPKAHDFDRPGLALRRRLGLDTVHVRCFHSGMPNRSHETGVFRCFAFGILGLLVCCNASLPVHGEERAAPNDFFAAAMRLPGGARSFMRTVQLSESTAESGEPLYNGQVVHNSVWLRWTPTYSGTVLMVPVSVGYAVKLDVFEGSEISGLFPLAANHVAGLRSDVAVAFRAVAGRTYSIRLQDTRSLRPVFARFATLHLRHLPNYRRQQRQLLMAQRSSFSVHPALLRASAQSLYRALWQSSQVVVPYRNRPNVGGTHGSIYVGIIGPGGGHPPIGNGPPPDFNPDRPPSPGYPGQGSGAPPRGR